MYTQIAFVCLLGPRDRKEISPHLVRSGGNILSIERNVLDELSRPSLGFVMPLFIGTDPTVVSRGAPGALAPLSVSVFGSGFQRMQFVAIAMRPRFMVSGEPGGHKLTMEASSGFSVAVGSELLGFSRGSVVCTAVPPGKHVCLTLHGSRSEIAKGHPLGH